MPLAENRTPTRETDPCHGPDKYRQSPLPQHLNLVPHPGARLPPYIPTELQLPQLEVTADHLSGSRTHFAHQQALEADRLTEIPIANQRISALGDPRMTMPGLQTRRRRSKPK